MAGLKQVGTIPDKTSRHSLKSVLEIGSRSHDLVLHEKITSFLKQWQIYKDLYH